MITIRTSYALLFAALATGAAVGAWYSWQSTRQAVRDGIRTQGVVLENRSPQRIGLRHRNKISTALAPVVQFQTADGQRITYQSTTYTTPARFDVGDTVELWYNPTNPQDVTLAGVDTWLLPVICGLFAFVFGLLGYVPLLRRFMASRR